MTSPAIPRYHPGQYFLQDWPGPRRGRLFRLVRPILRGGLNYWVAEYPASPAREAFVFVPGKRRVPPSTAKRILNRHRDKPCRA